MMTDDEFNQRIIQELDEQMEQACIAFYSAYAVSAGHGALWSELPDFTCDAIRAGVTAVMDFSSDNLVFTPEQQELADEMARRSALVQ